MKSAGGSRSTEARIVKQLRKRWGKDYQAYAFRVGDRYFIGAVPDALTELAILDLIAASDGWSRPTAALARLAGQITPSRSMKTPNRENPEVTEAMVVL